MRPSSSGGRWGRWVAPFVPPFVLFVRLAASVALAGVAVGCQGSEKANRPVSALTFDPVAKASFQDVRRSWERRSVAKRADVAEAIEAHIRTYPRDPTANPARAMLALIELDGGDLAAAWKLAEQARAAGPGVVRDDADVVRGAVLLRRDEAARAIAILRPLDGKIIDAHFRDAFDGELADAAVRTGDAPRALAAMRRWLLRTPVAERDAVKERIASLIARMEESTLRRALEGPLPEDDEDVVILRVAAGLARIARERRDAALARLLLDRVPDRLGEDADPLAAIAARAGGAAVAPKTIGLLVSSRSTELARRGLETASGLSYALRASSSKTGTSSGAPGVTAAPTLLVRDAQVDLEGIPDALARLASDGAGIVVAGFDRAEADAVATYAAESRLPVLLLTPPSRPSPAGSRIFVVGEEPSRVRRVLLDAFAAAGRSRVAVLASDPADVKMDEGDGATIVAVQPCGASLEFARGAAADAVLIDGGPDCARGATEGLEKLRRELRTAFSLDAATDPSAHDLLASAGLLPVQATPPELEGWIARGRAAPSWWAALGNDAGQLALAALDRAGGSLEARDVRAVEARRAELAAALEVVEAPLWTTRARGFSRGRSLPREIGTVEVAPPKRR